MIDKLTLDWAGNSTQQNQEILTVCDVLAVNSFATPGNTYNTIQLTLGVASTGEVYTKDALLFSPPGLISAPVPSGSYDINGNYTPSGTSATGSKVVAYVRNNEWIVLGTQDTRTQLQAGSLGAGETCLMGLLGQGKVLIKPDGSVNMMTTTTNDATGSSVQFTVSPTAFTMMAPWGSFIFDQYGCRITCSNGASFSMMATPDPSTGNSVTLTAGTATISSGTIILGNPVNTVVPLPVVYGVLPVAVPGIPILGEGVGMVTVNAAASTSVFVGI